MNRKIFIKTLLHDPDSPEVMNQLGINEKIFRSQKKPIKFVDNEFFSKFNDFF